jgi:hypothetical protein
VAGRHGLVAWLGGPLRLTRAAQRAQLAVLTVREVATVVWESQARRLKHEVVTESPSDKERVAKAHPSSRSAKRWRRSVAVAALGGRWLWGVVL